MKLLLITIILLICYKIVNAQSKIDTTYKIEITVTASPLINFYRNERYPGSINHIGLGEGIFIRGMWHPGRLLSVGILSGYALISQDKFNIKNNTSSENGNGASAKLDAIPIQLAVSMQSKKLEVGLGMGPYLMLSTIYYGKPASGRRFELGLTFYSLYHFPITTNFSLGPEIRILYLSYRGILSIMPSISLRLVTLEY